MKEISYDQSSKMQRLKEFWISKASADQRKGRAGRTGPGVCYRLYGQKSFEEFDEFSTAEINRVPLESLLLQMISMGLPNARLFPFIEPPPADSLEQSIYSLKKHVRSKSKQTPYSDLRAANCFVGRSNTRRKTYTARTNIVSIASGH